MSLGTFVARHVRDIRDGGVRVVLRKSSQVPGFIVAMALSVPFVLVIRLLRPLLLVRIGRMESGAIGHFSANTELYLCERDAGINVPAQRYTDIFFTPVRPVCNEQLGLMWRRLLRIWPAWFMLPLSRVNARIPGGSVHEVGDNTQWDRDVHNLLDRMPAHLAFTPEETARGNAGLRAMGIPEGVPFVCLIVRDGAYYEPDVAPDAPGMLNHRNNNIDNFVPAARALADRGYYVIRMGVRVWKPLDAAHPRVIDYATNGMRTDFMDIYLGAHCAFCVTTSTGFDGVPLIFRRPLAQVNAVPIAWLYTFRHGFLNLARHHHRIADGKRLTLREIIASGCAYTDEASDFTVKGIRVAENTADELCELVVEMDERVRGTWVAQPNDDSLQRRFWDIFPVHGTDAENGGPLHGEIRSRFGAAFLRANPTWLD